ncbi:MAG: MBL fold metallo-hydrolase [Clostridia bacterium]
MKLTVLGKYGPYPKQGNTACSGYLINDDQTNILLDMGSGVLTRLTNIIDINSLDAIIFSHLHFDHTSDLLPLRYLLDELGKPIDIYVQYEDTAWYKLLFNHPLLNVHNITKDSNLIIGKLKLSFSEMKHPVPTLAIKIIGDKEFLYTGDTQINTNLLNAVKACDYILADCSKSDNFKGPHMTIKDGLTINNNSNAIIFATHISPDYSPEKDYENYENIIVVNELQTYNLD